MDLEKIVSEAVKEVVSDKEISAVMNIRNLTSVLRNATSNLRDFYGESQRDPNYEGDDPDKLWNTIYGSAKDIMTIAEDHITGDF